MNESPNAGIVARTRWLRVARLSTTTLLEIFVSLTVMAVCISVAVRSFLDAKTHMAVVQAVYLAQDARVAMIEFRAVVGDWPASNSAAGYNDPRLHSERYGSAGIRAGGAVDFRFPQDGTVLADRVVSIRAWQGPDSASPTSWLCAHAGSRALTPASADRTTVRDRDLPASCRVG
jgi:type II secretory pathway pseudopilin PulG